MVVEIYLKEADSPLVLDNIEGIGASEATQKPKKYTKENMSAFALSAGESYVFENEREIVSVSGREILFVRFIKD